MSKLRLRLSELPARVKNTGAYRASQSTAWGMLPRNGDHAIYLGNRGEKLSVGNHTVLLSKQFPRWGEGYDHVIESLMR